MPRLESMAMAIYRILPIESISSGDYHFGTTPGKHGLGRAALNPVRVHGEILCGSYTTEVALLSKSYLAGTILAA